jgi:multiple sugar transport system permease protein
MNAWKGPLLLTLVLTAPVIVIFFFAQKYFIQGVTLTGLKG